MRIVKGKAFISIEHIEGFGKNPGLWIGRNNVQVKVASFSSQEKAEAFCKWLSFIVGAIGDEQARVDWFLNNTGSKNTKESEGNG